MSDEIEKATQAAILISSLLAVAFLCAVAVAFVVGQSSERAAHSRYCDSCSHGEQSR